GKVIPTSTLKRKSDPCKKRGSLFYSLTKDNYAAINIIATPRMALHIIDCLFLFKLQAERYFRHLGIWLYYVANPDTRKQAFAF
ncbi:MAG: hypothetical protein HW384_134, partial [Dehalococcoidia bacterium]|nr:hypothetical protein [Dehalococcoidia bacterium]